LNISNNENLDIKFSAHYAFLEKPSLGTLKVKRVGSQIIVKYIAARNPKGVNRGANIDYGHTCLREEVLRFNNSYII
jgi:hypothetical protein